MRKHTIAIFPIIYLNGGLSIEDSIQYAIQVCDALLYAQQIIPGFVHCDIHPGNILIDYNRDAKLTDFGLSKTKELLTALKDASAHILDTGHVNYLAPERWLGNDYDQTTDVYALGCVLYEMVEGMPAFNSRNIDDIKKMHLSGHRPKLAGTENVFRELNKIISKCIAIEKNKRWSDVAAFRESLLCIQNKYCLKINKPEKKEKALKSYINKTNEALTYFQLQEYDKALLLINDSIEEFYDFSPSHNYKGLILKAMGNANGALACFDQAIILDPTDPLPYINKGVCLKDINNYPEAIANYKKAIDIDRSVELAHTNLGKLYFLMNEYDLAIDEFSRAIDLNPQQGSFYWARANVLYKFGSNPQFVLEDIDHCLKLNPYFAEAHVLKGDMLKLLYDELHKNTQININFRNAYLRIAIDEYTKALDMENSLLDKNYNPDFKVSNKSKVYSARGEAYYLYGDLDKALEDLNVAIEMSPDSEIYFHIRAKILCKLGEADLAENDFNKNKVLKLISDWTEQAEALTKEGKYKEAIALYALIIEKFPDISDGYTNRGLAYELLENYEKAETDYNKALELDPFDCDILVNLSNLYWALNNNDKAIYYLKKAAEYGDFEAAARLQYVNKFGDLPTRPRLMSISSDSNYVSLVIEKLTKAKSIQEFIDIVVINPVCKDPSFIEKIKLLIDSQKDKMDDIYIINKSVYYLLVTINIPFIINRIIESKENATILAIYEEYSYLKDEQTYQFFIDYMNEFVDDKNRNVILEKISIW